MLRLIAVATLSLLSGSALVACSSRPSEPPDAGGCPAHDAGAAEACDATVGDASCAASSTSPSLTSLSVTGGSGGGLVPAFSPGVHDYYVLCAAGINDLAITMTASGGATSSLAHPDACRSCFAPGAAASAPAPRTSVNASVLEGQAIVAAATRGDETEEYWVRCLPHDFPPMTWTPRADGCARTPGYYLVGTLGLTPGVSAYAMVLDANGVPVFYEYNGAPVYDVESLRAGAISFAVPWQFDVLSPPSVTAPLAGGVPPDEHELRLLPNGHYLGLSSAMQTGVDLTGLTIPLYDGGVKRYGPDGSILACDVLEFEPSGAIVWRWTATDHFDPVAVMTLRSPDLAEPTVEPFHCNSIDVDPANGNLLVSARDMSSVFYIDRATSKVLWKMGGANSSKDGAAYVAVADPFVGQHDARLLPGWRETAAGGEGQVSLFDDETFVGPPARGVVYDVTVGGAGGAATVSFQYPNWMEYSSAVTGGFRVNADGSRIIGWGQSDPMGSPLVFTEVDAQGNDLLDLFWPGGNDSYRAIKEPLTTYSLAALRRGSQ